MGGRPILPKNCKGAGHKTINLLKKYLRDRSEYFRNQTLWGQRF